MFEIQKSGDKTSSGEIGLEINVPGINQTEIRDIISIGHCFWFVKHKFVRIKKELCEPVTVAGG